MPCWRYTPLAASTIPLYTCACSSKHQQPAE
jgi:hypothetical protein